MGALEKITFGIMGIGIAAGAAYLILELSKTHLNSSKTIVDVASKVGDLAADNISNRSDDKPIIEGLKTGKDFLAEVAKEQLDKHHSRNIGWRF